MQGSAIAVGRPTVALGRLVIAVWASMCLVATLSAAGPVAPAFPDGNCHIGIGAGTANASDDGTDRIQPAHVHADCTSEHGTSFANLSPAASRCLAPRAPRRDDFAHPTARLAPPVPPPWRFSATLV